MTAGLSLILGQKPALIERRHSKNQHHHPWAFQKIIIHWVQ